MEYSKGELWDRWTIERRKWCYGAGNVELLKRIEQSLDKFDVTPLDARYVAELAMANDSIAVLEWQIRADHKLSDEEVGLRAREIRNINARRVAAKNLLDGRTANFIPAFDIPIDKLTLAIPDSAK